MKIALLSGASSIHTIRWANGLCTAGHEVHVITQHPAAGPFSEGVVVHQFPFRGVAGYFIIVPAVRKLLAALKPDIVNAHYASGYATTARLVGFHPWLLSVWGSDVYDFPYKSPLHKWLVRKNLTAADQVASTSHCMAKQSRTLVPKISDIAITPFGVDLSSYEYINPEPIQSKSKLVIGTVKTMKPKYGIDTLIESFALLLNHLNANDFQDIPELELRLVGGGDQTPDLKVLSHRLGVEDKVHFVGHVPHTQVPQELAKLDIYVALSRLDSESFGVAIIEASAAGRPVIVSDAGGLPEVTLDGETGFVVPRENPEAASSALKQLVMDAELRHRMGSAGQRHVAQQYSWSACVNTMCSVYQNTIDKLGKDK